MSAEDAPFATVLRPASDLEVSMPVLEDSCDHLEELESDPPRLPTSVEREVFLLCDIGSGRIGLSYSDGVLVLTQLRGADLIQSVVGDLVEFEEPVPYSGLEIYPSAALAIDSAGEEAWLLAPDDLHAHLFLFTHPLLVDPDQPAANGSFDELLPGFVDIGDGLAAVHAELSDHCVLHEEREIQPTTLPGVSDSQVQIDCFGLEVMGFPRKAEFVFADGHLALVWILTGAEEAARLHSRLIDLYGAPLAELEAYSVWPDGVALRKDVPEIMIASPDVATALIGQ